MSGKRKRKNGEQTFISWQLGAWRRLIDEDIEGFKRDWDDAKWDEKTSLVGCIIPVLLITALAFCGVLPSMLFRISAWYSTIACVGVYAFILAWIVRCWLNGRYDKYIDDVENDDKEGNEAGQKTEKQNMLR